MADKTSIEWTDASWTPIRARNKATGKVGWHCEHATTGCINCYSEGMNHRLGTWLPYKPGHRKDIELFLDEGMLAAPFKWRKPRMIFVCSMTDLFADFVPDEWIDRMFAVMALCPQHTFQCLTKRSARMREYFTAPAKGRLPRDGTAEQRCREAHHLGKFDNDPGWRGWPLPNVWLGVSCERQQEADERIPDLLATPAAVRFVSAEPLLGPIDLQPGLTGVTTGDFLERQMWPGLDWVIVGGESGPGARPFDLEWARTIVAQCKAADVACFVKQIGAHPVDSARPCVPEDRPLRLHGKDRKGGDPSEWPIELRVRQMPSPRTETREAA